MAKEPLSILFGFHEGSNKGYALAHYERIFYEAGLQIAGNRLELLHFSYKNYERGRPEFLPREFANLAEWDYSRHDRQSIKKMADYAERHRIDVVVLVDFDPLHELAAELRSHGVKSVVAYWGAPVSSLMPWWKLALKRAEVALASSKADVVVFESEAMAKTATHGRGLPAARTRVIRQGVNIERYRPNPGSRYVHEQLGFEPQRKVVVYSGHMEERKGVRVLVEAAIELLDRRERQDVAFLVCGNRTGERERFERMLQGTRAARHVKFGGYRSDLSQIYPSCFLGVIPTTGWDSFPYSPIEMAASGLPVVASNLQGLAESVLDGETGLLAPPGNAPVLADRIESLLDRPGLAQLFGAHGRARCESELNTRAHLESLTRLVHELV